MLTDLPPSDPEAQVRAVVERLKARYQWQLLAPDDLTQRTLRNIEAGIADQPTGAVIATYCAAMYEACLGREGNFRQNVAYSELARYLYSLARTRFPDLRPEVLEDVTQSALERVFRGIDRCREPHAFFAFAAQHLLNAVRIARRDATRPVQYLERGAPNGELSPYELQPDPPAEPLRIILAHEQQQGVEQFLHEFAQRNPQARLQVKVLRLWLLHDLDDQEISRRLNVSLASVYTARSRALKQIRSDPQWRTHALALGMLDPEQ